MEKENVVHIFSGILFSLKKECNNAICNDMGEPRDCLTGVKSDREREIYDITYMWNLKNGTTEFIYSRVTDVENMVTRRES